MKEAECSFVTNQPHQPHSLTMPNISALDLRNNFIDDPITSGLIMVIYRLKMAIQLWTTIYGLRMMIYGLRTPVVTR
jgi:hypothetical protein